MKIEQRILGPSGSWETSTGSLEGLRPQFAFVFGARALLEKASIVAKIRDAFPGTRLVFASACGILGVEICENCVGVTAVVLEKTSVDFATMPIPRYEDSHSVACALAQTLSRPGLAHVFVLADEHYANGTELARGFNETLPAGVAMTGGLASEEADSVTTIVGLDTAPEEARMVAVGFYGRDLRVGVGVSGGWVPFGPERVVTRAEGNTLFDLDGQSALGLYKKYLGAQAALLPAAALRFPLSMTPRDGGQTLVRASLRIDEATQSMHLAGDIATGSRVRFLRASYDDLIDGAGRAAELARGNQAPELAICVGCIGRKIVLGLRTEEEIENIKAVFGPTTALTGFFSHGELAPSVEDPRCRLHNETMTITTFREEWS